MSDAHIKELLGVLASKGIIDVGMITACSVEKWRWQSEEQHGNVVCIIITTTELPGSLRQYGKIWAYAICWLLGQGQSTIHPTVTICCILAQALSQFAKHCLSCAAYNGSGSSLKLIRETVVCAGFWGCVRAVHQRRRAEGSGSTARVFFCAARLKQII